MSCQQDSPHSSLKGFCPSLSAPVCLCLSLPGCHRHTQPSHQGVSGLCGRPFVTGQGPSTNHHTPDVLPPHQRGLASGLPPDHAASCPAGPRPRPGPLTPCGPARRGLDAAGLRHAPGSWELPALDWLRMLLRGLSLSGWTLETAFPFWMGETEAQCGRGIDHSSSPVCGGASQPPGPAASSAEGLGWAPGHFNHSLAHSFLHAFILPITSFIHSLHHSLIHSLTHSLCG